MQAVGDGVTRFKPGEAVFGSAGMGMACHAEYRVFRETGAVAAKPPKLSHREAAALPFGAQTALAFLRDKAGLRPGERVLVIGASGAVGCAAVQIAKALGAVVTAVTSARNADLVRGLGADAVVEYDRTPLVASSDRYDVIVDTVGEAGWAALKPLFAEKGRLAAVAASLPDMLRAGIINLSGGRRIVVGDPGESRALVEEIAALAEAGALRPVIDSVFPLDDVVKAHARVDTRRKVGAVVMEISPDPAIDG